jgi:hypothetical protein
MELGRFTVSSPGRRIRAASMRGDRAESSVARGFTAYEARKDLLQLL